MKGYLLIHLIHAYSSEKYYVACWIDLRCPECEFDTMEETAKRSHEKNLCDKKNGLGSSQESRQGNPQRSLQRSPKASPVKSHQMLQ